jgi:F-type H+-transporting ATPase subunit beta
MMAAEQFTGQPGSTVPLKETIEAFDKLAKGDFDHLPEQAFFLIGGLEDLQRKAESLGAKMDDSASDGAPAGSDSSDDDADDDDDATDDDARDDGEDKSE